MTISPDSLRADLVGLAKEAAKSAGTARRIEAAAGERRATVDERLKAIRPRTVLDQAAADEYQALTLERGQLDIVGGRAQA